MGKTMRFGHGAMTIIIEMNYDSSFVVVISIRSCVQAFLAVQSARSIVATPRSYAADRD